MLQIGATTKASEFRSLIAMKRARGLKPRPFFCPTCQAMHIVGGSGRFDQNALEMKYTQKRDLCSPLFARHRIKMTQAPVKV